MQDLAYELVRFDHMCLFTNKNTKNIKMNIKLWEIAKNKHKYKCIKVMKYGSHYALNKPPKSDFCLFRIKENHDLN